MVWKACWGAGNSQFGFEKETCHRVHNPSKYHGAPPSVLVWATRTSDPLMNMEKSELGLTVTLAACVCISCRFILCHVHTLGLSTGGKLKASVWASKRFFFFSPVVWWGAEVWTEQICFHKKVWVLEKSQFCVKTWMPSPQNTEAEVAIFSLQYPTTTSRR